MSDTELNALAALVNAYSAETQAANDSRKSQGFAMAYDCFADQESLLALRNEMRRRGVFNSGDAAKGMT